MMKLWRSLGGRAASLDVDALSGTRKSAQLLQSLVEPPSSTRGGWSSLLFRRRRPAVPSLHASVDKIAKLYPPRGDFVPLRESPYAELRATHNAAVQFSSCPVCLDAEDRLPSEEWDAVESVPGGTGKREPAPKSRLRPTHVCPDCGWPTHCSAEHAQLDRERHAQVCPSLRQWIEDEQDARSGRKFWEMAMPGAQSSESVLNFRSWPYLFATRRFPKPLLSSPIAQRHVSRYLTYPYTIASMLYNPWTYYDSKEEDAKQAPTVTSSGWHLLSGLSQAMDMAVKSASKEHTKVQTRERQITFTSEATAPMLTNDPFRIFIVGPRVECALPSFVWEQLSATFPGVPLRLYFIGPDCTPPSIHLSAMQSTMPAGHRSILPATRVHQRSIDTGDGQTVSSLIVPVGVNLRMEYIRAPYEQVHATFGKFHRRRDMFVFFNSGIGHYLTAESWKPALHAALETRCLMLFTSVNQEDQDADVETIQRECEGEYVVAVRPTINKFASMRPDIPVDSVHDEAHWVNCNWGLFGIHGIGKEVDGRREDFAVEEEGKSSRFWSWK